METAAARKHEHELSEGEVLGESLSDDVLGDEHELPAVDACGLAGAASADIIVVVHVEVEDELALNGTDLLVVLGRDACPDCACVQLARGLVHERGHAVAHLEGATEFEVSLDTAIVVLEGQLAVHEGDGVVVGQPPVHGVVGVQVLVVVPQILGVHLCRFWRENYIGIYSLYSQTDRICDMAIHTINTIYRLGLGR